jgi:hypothetical protein
MWKKTWKIAPLGIGLFSVIFWLVRCGKPRQKLIGVTRPPQRPKKFRLRATASGDENRNEGGILTDYAQCGKRKLAEDLHGHSQDTHILSTGPGGGCERWDSECEEQN